MTNHEISKEWIKAFGYLNEPQKRWFAAVKAKELGYGGVSQVSRATGLSRTTVTQGLRDLEEDGSLSLDSDRLRREGGGRKYSRHKSPELLKAIEGILEESSAGDPMSRLRWTCKSTRSIADQLRKSGFDVSYVTVMRLLKELGYSLRSNKRCFQEKIIQTATSNSDTLIDPSIGFQDTEIQWYQLIRKKRSLSEISRMRVECGQRKTRKFLIMISNLTERGRRYLMGPMT